LNTEPPVRAKHIQIPEYRDFLRRIGRRYRRVGKGLRAQDAEIARLQLIHDVIASKLSGVEKLSRLIRELDPFYRELIFIEFSEEKVKKAVSCLLRAKKMVSAFYRKYRYRLMASETAREARKTASEARGRMLSLVKRCEKQLLLLKNLVVFLQKLPSIDPSLPTILVAGAPSVGKSTIVTNASRARIEVASYPFTTKQVHVGHTEISGVRIQLIDTPGLLDRPLDERNPIELRAIAALKHLRGPILFLFDPTHEATLDLERQIHLAIQVKHIDTSKPFIPVIAKVDLVDEEQVSEAARLIYEKMGAGKVYTVIGVDKKSVNELIEKIYEEILAASILEAPR